MEVVCLILGPMLINFSKLFACFLGFDIPTSSFIFSENVFLLFLVLYGCSMSGER